MHYIAGTQIKLSGKTISPKKSLQGLTGAQIRKLSTGATVFQKEREQFTPDRTYTLIRVCKDRESENLIYTFSDGIDITPVLFPDVNTAETFISEIKNESIPDYSGVYINRTD